MSDLRPDVEDHFLGYDETELKEVLSDIANALDREENPVEAVALARKALGL